MTVDHSQRNNRMILLLIAGIPVTIILAATWLWFFVARGDIDLVGMLGTANQGTLVDPPRELSVVERHGHEGEELLFAGPKRKWTMLVVNAEPRCDDICESSLYLTRQIHTAMGKEYNRLRQAYISPYTVSDTAWTVAKLSDDEPLPVDFSSYLSGQQPELQALSVSKVDFTTLFAEHLADPTTWYLVDPEGWVMMSYNSEVSYKDVMSDLKFLLKNSSE